MKLHENLTRLHNRVYIERIMTNFFEFLFKLKSFKIHYYRKSIILKIVITLNRLVIVSKLTDQLLLTNALNFQKRFNHFKNSQVKRWLFLFLASYEECIMKKHVYVSDCSYFKKNI